MAYLAERRRNDAREGKKTRFRQDALQMHIRTDITGDPQPRPLPRVFIMLRPIVEVELSDLGDERVLGVRIHQERRDGEDELLDCERGRPHVSEDVDGDSALVRLQKRYRRRVREGQKRREKVCFVSW